MKKLLLLFLIVGAQTLSSQSFYDDFSYNNFNWNTVSSTQEYRYVNGKVSIYQVREKQGYSAGILVHNNGVDQSKDFKITSNMRLANGSTGNGLAWNFQNKRNHYKFLITDRDGQYAIYRISNGTATAIKKWGGASSINKKFAWNELSIEKRGDRTFFYINGVEVHNTYISYNNSPAKVGIFLGEGTVGNRVSVEDFRLEYNGGNSNNSEGEQDRAPNKY